MRNIYLLKDLAHLSGHSVHTLKYYLQLGLFEEMGRSPTTNFRFFDDIALERVKKIRELRLKNLPLVEIKQILK
jgi:DNA-binding transcriptional MerR regulator